MTYEDLNLTMGADDGSIINITGSFERIGYPTEEEMMQHEREVLAKLDREEVAKLDAWLEALEEAEREEQAGFCTDESGSSTASAQIGDP